MGHTKIRQTNVEQIQIQILDYLEAGLICGAGGVTILVVLNEPQTDTF